MPVPVNFWMRLEFIGDADIPGRVRGQSVGTIERPITDAERSPLGQVVAGAGELQDPAVQEVRDEDVPVDVRGHVLRDDEMN